MSQIIFIVLFATSGVLSTLSASAFPYEAPFLNFVPGLLFAVMLVVALGSQRILKLSFIDKVGLVLVSTFSYMVAAFGVYFVQLLFMSISGIPGGDGGGQYLGYLMLPGSFVAGGYVGTAGLLYGYKKAGILISPGQHRALLIMGSSLALLGVIDMLMAPILLPYSFVFNNAFLLLGWQLVMGLMTLRYVKSQQATSLVGGINDRLVFQPK